MRVDLFGLLLNVNCSAAPSAEMRPNEGVQLGEELLSDRTGADEGEQRPPHRLVEGTMDGGDVPPPQNIHHRLGVPRNEALSFVHEDEPVHLWIHGDDGGAAQYVGLEQISVPTEEAGMVREREKERERD